MPTTGITAKDLGIQDYLDSLLSRSNAMSGWLDRVAYPLYQNYQRNRWMDENAAETGQWNGLSAKYAARKRIMYGGGPKYEWIGGRPPWRQSGNWPVYPGSGTKLLIATGRLVGSVTGDVVTDHFKAVSGNSLIIGTTVKYAGYVDEARSFTDYDDGFIEALGSSALDYLNGDIN